MCRTSHQQSKAIAEPGHDSLVVIPFTIGPLANTSKSTMDSVVFVGNYHHLLSRMGHNLIGEENNRMPKALSDFKRLDSHLKCFLC